MSILEPRTAGFVSRAAAGLVAPRSVSKNITPADGGTLVHYGGSDVPTSSHASAKDRWRSWQRYHMETRGWADIAYTMGVDNWGFVYAGRGAGVRTAANGTAYANQHYYAVCWIGGAKQTPTPAALSAIAWAVQSLRDSGAGLAVGNHSDFRSTSCPGDDLRAETVKIDNVELEEPETEVDSVVILDIPLIGNWDGKGTGAGIHRGKQFLLRRSLSGGDAEILFDYGREGDVPVVGDWNGDGKDGIGIVRGNSWYLRNSVSAGSADEQLYFGSENDTFLSGDFNGDGYDTPAIFRDGTFYIKNSLTSGDADIVVNFGREGDIPVIGDWDGDGVDGIGIYRENRFYLRNRLNDGPADLSITYGREGDVPLAGDWNNLGSDSIGVRRGETFYLLASLFEDKQFNYGR